MKISPHTNSMYNWAIILLLFLAVVASYSRQAFPVNLLISILTCSVLDILIKKFLLKKKFSFPSTAIISGTIIGSIAPFSSNPLLVIVASIVAILSKHIIRFKGTNVFNPAATGLLVSLAIFSLNDEWWAATSYNIIGYAIPLAFLLIIANYKSRKLGISLSFLLTLAILYYISGFISLSFLPYYFAFIMLSEPKTSPYKIKEQIIYGILMAILLFVLLSYSIKYSFFIALLIGNIAYALYKYFK